MHQRRDSIAILMCTFNGALFLTEQLQSFDRQQGGDITLWVSDDGSSDDTCDLLEQYRRRQGDECVRLLEGPRRGFVANFLTLASRVEGNPDYIAFADQDDIWEPDKLQRAITSLKAVRAGTPAIYCSRTLLIDELGHQLGLSPRFRKPPSFANALVQNIGGGNTMVLNREAFRLLRETGAVEVVSHDWWAYMLVTGVGGEVIYDPYPTVRYRQHTRNLVGSNRGWLARSFRLRLLMAGSFREWNSRNIRALEQRRSHLVAGHRDMLERFGAARQKGGVAGLVGIWRSGVYRQTFMGNVGLIVAAFLKRL